ncbi:LacI family transcriptional regulator [Paenibacillus selenitireducens]|uniref:LacI family transcriptional regulator n=1 Tax=Paenibacillus selenitireducens TaxID=1324314 RepID=A0A1T2XM11_9BACL|nr:LacI family DNA-binding transcriptional regulator [Paenibacillus selenitireducens]OPA80891.1 LacI family transcriptional regulator [Paenibacillus selenitireducens]
MGVKIKDVARVAGVSVTSVSRVLNKGEHVSEKLEKKVLRAIEELNYSPSLIAKSLKRNKTNLIGVIIPDITSHFQATILSSIEETAGKKGYNLLVSNIVEDTEKVVKYLNVFQDMRVDGIVLMHAKMNDDIRHFLTKTQIPLVVHADLGMNLPTVIIDDYKAGYDATSYLIQEGHQRIAMIAGDMRDLSAGRKRYEGYLAACKDHGLTVDESIIRFGDYKLATGYKLMNELLTEAGGSFTSVFAASDDMAVGAMNCIQDHQLHIPGDISVMGFDGSQIADVVRPRLTTIKQPVDQIGQMTIDLLLNLIEQSAAPSSLQPMRKVILAHELIAKGSCRNISGKIGPLIQ